MGSLKRISFLAHSLGGLFARYAIAVLYSENALYTGQSNDLADSTLPCSARSGTIAGLDPINFVTLATPHLGVRGRKQVCLECKDREGDTQTYSKEAETDETGTHHIPVEGDHEELCQACSKCRARKVEKLMGLRVNTIRGKKEKGSSYVERRSRDK
ncbi:hypothetical protein GH714_012948 [Hevea brasiliensis]|uniref:DUF676 domain-containing protein n=1 Tax=Hevea brasiliensis TaxID=3981 RepID=A0A6A6LNQ7_HEVBR|nr:hypothetical protein GH714_012948 [Hevea brasiliensis]